MKIVCAWCGKTLQEGKEPVSHGICADCAKTLKEAAKYPIVAIEEGTSQRYKFKVNPVRTALGYDPFILRKKRVKTTTKKTKSRKTTKK